MKIKYLPALCASALIFGCTATHAMIEPVQSIHKLILQEKIDDAVNQLKTHQYLINKRDLEHNTPLHIAVLGDKPSTAESFLEKLSGIQGLHINTDLCNKAGLTAYAIAKNHFCETQNQEWIKVMKLIEQCKKNQPVPSITTIPVRSSTVIPIGTPLETIHELKELKETTDQAEFLPPQTSVYMNRHEHRRSRQSFCSNSFCAYLTSCSVALGLFLVVLLTTDLKSAF